MLHTKFHGNPSNGSGEDFRRVFNIYGHGGHLGHVTSIMSLNFNFLVPYLTYKIWFKMAHWFLKKKNSFNFHL